MMNNRTRDYRRWRRRAVTVVGLAATTVAAVAVPVLAHPIFSNNPPGFPNPQGSTTTPYSAGSSPTLNMFLPFEQQGITFHGADNTTVDTQVPIPAGWTSPVCGAASTSTGNQQVGVVVPGWSCVIETVSGHQVLHWHGPQIGPPPLSGDVDSAQFFTFQVTVPSPAATTSYGATGSTAEGFFVQQVYADGTTELWRSPNDTTRPPAAQVAFGIVRTVAGPPLEGLADPNVHPLMNALSNVIKDGGGNKIIGLDPPCSMTGGYQGLSDIDKLIHSMQVNDGCLQFVTSITGPTPAS
jgi:hypothetical protein